MIVYGVVPTVSTGILTSSSSANTELAALAMRQATRSFFLRAIRAFGKKAALTTLNGIEFKARRWTTAGSGGTAITPAARGVIIAPAASTVCASGETAITVGTVSGALQCSFGCGAAGPGAWSAQDKDDMILVETGSADEIDVYSQCAAASMDFNISADIGE